MESRDVGTSDPIPWVVYFLCGRVATAIADGFVAYLLSYFPDLLDHAA